jgi:hypothetical protein
MQKTKKYDKLQDNRVTNISKQIFDYTIGLEVLTALATQTAILKRIEATSIVYFYN